MSARFRIRTSLGQEISFASLEVFSEFVRAGDLSPEDVVYDAETREWSSAQTHPIVVQIQVESEEEARGAEGGDPDESGTPDGNVSTLRDIGLDLAPAESSLTPDEAAAIFVKEMQAERAGGLDLGEDMQIQSFTMDQQVFSAPPSKPRAVERPPVRHERPMRLPEPSREPMPRRESAARRTAPAPVRGNNEPSLLRYAPVALVMAVVGSGVFVLGPRLMSSRAEPEERPDPAGAVAAPSPAGTIADDEETVRGRARERFLTSTQAAFRDLQPIPDIWLRGRYLATPSDYPGVREVWAEYLSAIREVRAGDDDRYREAYSRALDDARVAASSREARLATAMEAFRASEVARARHYDRVEALASAAVRGHDALVGAEGTIVYEPASGSSVSRDPVLEAAGRGPEAQALLERVLDMILAELQAPGGAGEAPRVREWVWGGLLDAVAN